MIFLARMLLFLVFSSCTIKHSFVTPTYEELEKNKLKKIVHYLKPFKSEKSIKNLYYQISRAYISHHKEYLLITAKRATKLENIKKLCKLNKKADGILISQFEKIDDSKNSIEMRLKSSLYNCPNQKLIWQTIAENSYAKKEDDLKVLTSSYVGKLGTKVENHVAPFYQITRKLFDTLPNPKLTEDEEEEKLELDSQST